MTDSKVKQGAAGDETKVLFCTHSLCLRATSYVSTHHM